MKDIEDKYIFESTGRVSKNYGTVHTGISETESGNFQVVQGFDQSWGFEEEDDWDSNEFTKEEKVELADRMISLWTKFKSN